MNCMKNAKRGIVIVTFLYFFIIVLFFFRVEGWEPKLRRMVEEVVVESLSTLDVKSSQKIEPWETTNVTFMGDAIHR